MEVTLEFGEINRANQEKRLTFYMEELKKGSKENDRKQESTE